MDNRFTIKDFVFVVLLVVVLGVVGFVSWQFHFQEERLNGVKGQLTDIQTQLRSGIVARGVVGAGGGGGLEARTGQRIREVFPDGSQFVCYPDVPVSPRDPTHLPDYAIGDWLVKNIGGEPKLLTPYIAKDMYSTIAQGPPLESLASQNLDTMEWEPYLADKYWISADGLRYSFHLRPQVCFSDGVKMTADDVLFSFNTVMNKDVDCEQLRGYYDRVKGCKKIDDATVEFEMKEPYFLAMDFVGSLQIIPEHVYKFNNGDDFNKKVELLVGSGAYRLDKWERGQKVTFVRNDHYWGDKPTFDKMVFVFISNSSAQLEAFLQGQLDELYEPVEPDPEQYLKYSKDPEFLKKFTPYKFSRPNSMYMYIGYNMTKPMFKDKETRQALTMLVDRKGIIDDMQLGFGTEMAGPFNIMRKANDPTLKPLAYDPAEAKKKLEAAGWKAGSDGVLARDGVKFEFSLSFRTGVPIRERIATRVQQSFKQAGIQMKLTPYESSVLIEHMDDRNFDACLMGWGSGGVEEDPYQIWNSDSIENKGSNHVSYRNPIADDLIVQGRRTLDEAKRMEIWRKLQRVIYEDQPYTWLYSEEDCAFVNGRFKNTKPYPTGLAEYDWYVPAGAQKYR